jgi:hypothetical protein
MPDLPTDRRQRQLEAAYVEAETRRTCRDQVLYILTELLCLIVGAVLAWYYWRHHHK